MPTLEALGRRLKQRRSAPAPFPSLWLFSDPVRLPEPAAAAARLPRGAGVVARGLGCRPLAALARVARGRGLRLVVAGDGRQALACRGGLHLPERRATSGLLPFLAARRRGAGRAVLTMASHGGFRAARLARRLRPDLIFLSPAFPTASHPGAPALGPLRWARLARALPGRVAALGGVTAASARRLPGRTAGLAAIGALARP